jgi:two-component system NtrC family sensor kinase
MSDSSLLKALSEDELAHALLQQQVALFERALDDIAEHTPEVSLNQAAARVGGLKSPVPGLWLVITPDLHIQHANEQAGRLLDMQSMALLGRPLAEVLPDAKALMSQVIDSEDAEITVEAQFRGYDGQPVPILLSIAQEKDAQDRVQYVLIGIDLREYHRTELLQRQAQKLEAMGSLAAGIAHEINTPLQYLGDNLSFIDEVCGELLQVLVLAEQELSASVAMTELLQRIDSAFIRENLPAALKRSQDGVSRVRDITRSMRSFTHISETANSENMAVLVQEAITLSAHEVAQVAKVVLELQDVPAVICRRDHIVQVLINLLTNACHAIASRLKKQPDSGPGQVTIALSQRENYIRLVVSDNGSGVEASLRHRIFDPFFTTKAVGQGTGQGLPISRALIVDQHKGKLWCEPAEPQGASFIIELPIQGVST